jgi:quinohemoprotein ethanol dehydrogenase
MPNHIKLSQILCCGILVLLQVCGACNGRAAAEPAAAESAVTTPAPVTPARAMPAQRFGDVDERRLADADRTPENWYAVNRGPASDHYSPLASIDEQNASTLGFAWTYDTESTRGLEASPVVIDGVMYASGSWGRVYALDAASGRELWRFDPHVPGKWGRRPCCDIVNRGVAVWKGAVYVAALDGRLFCLDARTGKPNWVRDTLLDHDRYQPSTGAPQIAGGKVVIGNAGAELGVRGYITAYDAASGAMAWRFFTVPGDPKLPRESPEMVMAAKTWDPASQWDVGGGGTVWDAMAYDAKLDLLYVGVGNGSPHPAFGRSPAGGDNLFLASIVAIRPQTGRMVWFYQTTPADSWDFTATQQMVLADLNIGGRVRQVIMQAPKNGFFYVLDRASGELLSAGKYGATNWASSIDLKTGRPVITGQGDYSKEPKLVYPGEAGAHNWRPMSFSPKSGLVYIPTIQWPMVFTYHPQSHYLPGKSNVQNGTDEIPTPEVQLGPAQPIVNTLDYLQAYDPVTQKTVWRVVTSDVPEQTGGVLSTAGNLVVQGDSSGFVHVYSASTGASLAHLEVGTSIMAAPISYAVDGVQYIAVMAGLGGAAGWEFPLSSAAYRYGNAGRIMTFKLGGGKTPLPPRVDRTRTAMVIPSVATSPEMIVKGETLFRDARCGSCHTLGRPGIAPDLLGMSAATHAVFARIVLQGLLESNGMASFADILSASDVDAIHAYLVAMEQKQQTAGIQARP